MSQSIVVSALIEKRRELHGLLHRAEATVQAFATDLEKLDATIRLFDPDIDLVSLKPKAQQPPLAANNGEVMRIVLDAMREAGRPLSTRAISDAVLIRRGLDTVPSAELEKTLRKRVSYCLRDYRERGLVRSLKGEGLGSFLLWEISG